LRIAVSMVVVLGLLASAPAFAKSAHAPVHALPSAIAPATATNAGSAKPAEPIDADVTVLTPRGGFTPANRNANASLKIVKPENFTRRPDITTPIKPIVRNAIGQPVPSRSVIGAPRLVPSLQAPGLVPKALTRSVVPAAPPLPPPIVGRTPVHPTTTVGIPSNGRIDGAHMIRPSAAPVGLGGPAHPVGGINGTAVRPNR
jgi:hypothetical protein